MYIFDEYKDWSELYGSCRALHSINAVRFDYITNAICIKNKNILDIGCGGGILSEKLRLHGANVTGIDKSKILIDIARRNYNSNVLYVNTDIEHFNSNVKYDIIVCMEVIEHLKNISMFFDFLYKIKSHNTQLFVSSLDKSILNYLEIIFFGEYVSKILQKNTHNYDNFTSIAELCCYFKENKFFIEDIKFIKYYPLLNFAVLSNIKSFNYVIKVRLC